MPLYHDHGTGARSFFGMLCITQAIGNDDFGSSSSHKIVLTEKPVWSPSHGDFDLPICNEHRPYL